MHVRQRPSTINTLAALHIVLGAILGLLYLCLANMLLSPEGPHDWFIGLLRRNPTPYHTQILVAAVVFGLVQCLFFLINGVALLQGHTWARRLSLFFAWLTIAAALSEGTYWQLKESQALRGLMGGRAGFNSRVQNFIMFGNIMVYGVGSLLVLYSICTISSLNKEDIKDFFSDKRKDARALADTFQDDHEDWYRRRKLQRQSAQNMKQTAAGADQKTDTGGVEANSGSPDLALSFASGVCERSSGKLANAGH